jgi:hypothetical protein
MECSARSWYYEQVVATEVVAAGPRSMNSSVLQWHRKFSSLRLVLARFFDHHSKINSGMKLEFADHADPIKPFDLQFHDNVRA